MKFPTLPLETMPEGLRKEYEKYLQDPRWYAKNYPVLFKLLKPYLKAA